MAIGAGALSFGLGAAGEVTGALALRQRGRAAQDPRTCRIARFCYRRSIYARAVGSRFFQFRRRSNGRPGGHAGLCIIPYPALASPPRRDHAVIRCHQRWHRDHARFGVEPSGFEPRPANPMVALVRLTANRNVMGEFANTQLTNAVAVAATAFVSALNAILLLGMPAYGSRSLAAEYSRGYCQGHPAARLKPVAVAAHRARRSRPGSSPNVDDFMLPGIAALGPLSLRIGLLREDGDGRFACDIAMRLPRCQNREC
jgi:hypothetical protein